MEKTKLTVRVRKDLLDRIKRYAELNNTTITNLIDACSRQIPASETLDNAPNVQKLSGVLPDDISVRDHKKFLEKKYG